MARPAFELVAPHLWNFSGSKKIGSQPSACWAVAVTLRPIRLRPPDRDVGAHRVVDDLERLAEPGALTCGKRHLHRLAVVLELLLALPDHAAGLDVLLDAHHRLLVGHAVEAFDDLGSRGAEAEDEPAVADVVAAGSRHRHQRRGAGVDVEDAGADLDPVGLGRQVADLADGVEAVRLGDPDHVEAGLLELDHDLVDRLLELTGVVDRHRELHAVAPSFGPGHAHRLGHAKRPRASPAT